MADYEYRNNNYYPVNNEEYDNNLIDGQQSFDIMPDGTLDVMNSEPKAMIVNEDGSDAFEPDKNALQLIRGGKFDARMFHEQFEDHTEEVLNALLAMQSNENPLKKGGDSIAFRCNAMILQNRQNYTVPQNTLMDIIAAHMSSRPDDKYYIIKAKDVVAMLPYEDKTYAYKLMSKTCKELNRQPFLFEIPLSNGKKRPLELHWNTTLTYNGSDAIEDGEDAYISFTPTKFFRILTASSTIMSGAHYPVGVPAQISSKYVRHLFYYLESMKNYREYPNATPGMFKLSLDDLQYIVRYPSSYRTTDIRRFVLDKAEEEISRIEQIDFTFRYEFIKTSRDGAKKKITHVLFVISTTYNITTKSEPIAIEEKSTMDDTAPLQVLAGVGLDTQQCKDVLKKYKKNNRDLIFLTQAITSVITNTGIIDKCAVLCKIMDEGLNENMTADKNMEHLKQKKSQKNKFNDFEQREYNNDELEKMFARNPYTDITE